MGQETVAAKMTLPVASPLLHWGLLKRPWQPDHWARFSQQWLGRPFPAEELSEQVFFEARSVAHNVPPRLSRG